MDSKVPVKLSRFLKKIAESLTDELNLSNLDITDEELKIILKALETNDSITKLNLAFNKLGKLSVKPLVQTLEDRKKPLIELRLSNNNIGPEGISDFTQALKTNTALETLYLSHNNIGTKGAKALAEVLKINTAIKSLYLAQNKIGSIGLASLSDSLKTNNTLTTIDLSDNRIWDDGIEVLVTALQHNKSLSSLNLSSNNLEEDAFKNLTKLLDINNSLISIDLKGIKIEQGLQSAIYEKTHKRQLEKIDESLGVIEKKVASSANLSVEVKSKFREIFFLVKEKKEQAVVQQPSVSATTSQPADNGALVELVRSMKAIEGELAVKDDIIMDLVERIVQLEQKLSQ